MSVFTISSKKTQLDIKAQIDPKIIIVDDFNTPFSTISRPFRQKKQQINFRIKYHYRSYGLHRHLQNVLSNSHIITFFSAAQRTLSRIDHILGCKESLFKIAI
jgi:hypothetical protein